MKEIVGVIYGAFWLRSRYRMPPSQYIVGACTNDVFRTPMIDTHANKSISLQLRRDWALLAKTAIGSTGSVLTHFKPFCAFTERNYYNRNIQSR